MLYIMLLPAIMSGLVLGLILVITIWDRLPVRARRAAPQPVTTKRLPAGQTLQTSR